MTQFIIIHNPLCSKCSQTMKILEEKGVQPKVIDYLNGELSREILIEALRALNIPAKGLLRTKEEGFKDLKINIDNSDEVLEAILKYPRFLERPIVIHGDKAVIARPAENVLKLFSSN